MWRVLGDMTLNALGTDDAQMELALKAAVVSYFEADPIDSSAWIKGSRQLAVMDVLDGPDVEEQEPRRRLVQVYDVHYQAFVHVQQEAAVKQQVALIAASAGAGDNDSTTGFDTFSGIIRQKLLDAGANASLLEDSFQVTSMIAPLVDMVSLSHISTSTTSSTTTTSTTSETNTSTTSSTGTSSTTTATLSSTSSSTRSLTSTTTSSNTSTTSTVTRTTTTSTTSTTSTSTFTNTSSSTSSTVTSTSTTSSTFTTTSTSSSTTSTTTLFYLRIESAEMRQSFTVILLTFNAPAIPTNQSSYERSVSCGSVFSATTLAAIGFLPKCTWFAQGKQLQVTLGRETVGMIKLGDLLEIPAGFLTVNPYAISLPAGYTPTLNATVFSRDPPVQPSAHLSASPPFSPACGRISTSTAKSIGNAGRSMKIRWGFGPQSTPGLVEELAAYISKANSDRSTGIIISPRSLSSAMKALQSKLGSSFLTSSPKLEFVVNVTNWFGLSDVASSIVEVDTSGEAVPLVFPTTETVLVANSSDEVGFAIATRYIDTSQCASTSSTTATTTTPVYTVIVFWEHREVGSGNWTRLEDVSALRDLSRRPGSVRFAPFSFEPGSLHQLRATASYANTSSTARKPSYTFNLTIARRPPPIAALWGPEVTSEACTFVIDTAPTVDTSLAPGEIVEFAYKWSCRALSSGATDCSTGLMRSLLRFARSTMPVPGGLLRSGTYEFGVAVSRRGSTGEPGTATIIVQLVSAGLPPIVMSAPWSNGSAVSTQVGGRLGTVSALVQGSGSCPVPDSWTWRWALVEEESPKAMVALLETTLERKDGSNEVNLTTNDFRGTFMTPGKRYFYALLMARSQVEMDALTASGAQDVETYLESGASVQLSEPFVADGPPIGGTLNIQPSFGYAVTSAFSLSTQGWTDEDPSSLTFAFYRFPLPTGVTLTADGDGGISLSGNPEQPSIDWLNSSSPLFWSNLGGLSLRTFATQPTLLDFVLPSGPYMIAVQAKDKFGGTSSTVAFGPLVENPTGGLSPEEAASALSSSLGSNDANDILTTVDAVSSVEIADVTPEKQKEMTSKLLDAMASAITVVEPAGVMKMGSVLSSVVRSSAGAGVAEAAAAADRATDMVDSVLAVAVGGESGGVDAAAGNALLGSINSIGNAFGEASGSPDDSTSSSVVNKTQAAAKAAARTEKLQRLVSQLGDAAMNMLPVGSTTTLSSVDASGKGSEIALKKASVAESISQGLAAPGLAVPGSALLGRRLQSVGSSSCSQLGVQQTNWLYSNPFGYANATVGLTSVAKNATVKVLEIKKCGSTVVFENLTTPLSIELNMPPTPTEDPPYAHRFEPWCVRFDPGSQRWTTDNLQPLGSTDKTLQCLASIGGGAYTGIFLPVPLPPTSTTTTLTSTATATSSTASSFTSTTTSTASVTHTQGPAAPAPPPGPDTGAIVGGVLGSLAFVVCVGLASLWVYRHKEELWRKSDGKVAAEPEPDAAKPAWEGRDAKGNAADVEKEKRKPPQEPSPGVSKQDSEQGAAEIKRVDARPASEVRREVEAYIGTGEDFSRRSEGNSPKSGEQVALPALPPNPASDTFTAWTKGWAAGHEATGSIKRDVPGFPSREVSKGSQTSFAQGSIRPSVTSARSVTSQERRQETQSYFEDLAATLSGLVTSRPDVANSSSGIRQAPRPAGSEGQSGPRDAQSAMVGVPPPPPSPLPSYMRRVKFDLPLPPPAPQEPPAVPSSIPTSSTRVEGDSPPPLLSGSTQQLRPEVRVDIPGGNSVFKDWAERFAIDAPQLGQTPPSARSGGSAPPPPPPLPPPAWNSGAMRGQEDQHLVPPPLPAADSTSRPSSRARLPPLRPRLAMQPPPLAERLAQDPPTPRLPGEGGGELPGGLPPGSFAVGDRPDLHPPSPPPGGGSAAADRPALEPPPRLSPPPGGPGLSMPLRPPGGHPPGSDRRPVELSSMLPAGSRADGQARPALEPPSRLQPPLRAAAGAADILPFELPLRPSAGGAGSSGPFALASWSHSANADASSAPPPPPPAPPQRASLSALAPPQFESEASDAPPLPSRQGGRTATAEVANSE